MATEQERTERAPAPEPGRDRLFSIMAMVAAVIAVMLGIGALALSLRSDSAETIVADSSTSASGTSTSTTASPTTTPPTTAPADTTPPTTTSSTASSTTEPSTSVPAPPFRSAIWPWPDAAVGDAAERFDDPVSAARSFAEAFVGFEDPIVGEFMQGDSRSGEVAVQAYEDGPVSTIFVRQLGDEDLWWVLGAAAEHVVLERPSALDVILQDLDVTATAPAVETLSRLVVRADGLTDPLVVEELTIGGAAGDLDTSITLVPPTTPGGAVLMLLLNGDGTPASVAAVRIVFDNS